MATSSAEWLTGALLTSGALTYGAVETFAVDTGRGNWSTNARLVLHYSPNARSALPRRLFLKMVNADLDDESFSASEVTYYTRDYVGMADAPLLRCYAGDNSAAHRRYYLLLDEVSETHVEAAPKTPTLDYGLDLAEGLAALHAHWWAHTAWRRPTRLCTVRRTSAVLWISPNVDGRADGYAFGLNF